MRDPYELLSDPAALSLLRTRAAMGFVHDPAELAQLAAVDAERERRKSFAAAGELVTPE